MRFALLFLLAGCEVKVTTPTKVDVNCEAASDGVHCTVKQTEGTSEAEACWDFTVTCEQGTVKTPRMCAKVKDGGTVKADTPRDKLIGIDTCKGDPCKTPDFVTPHKN
jgi:hypothetical protein